MQAELQTYAYSAEAIVMVTPAGELYAFIDAAGNNDPLAAGGFLLGIHGKVLKLVEKLGPTTYVYKVADAATVAPKGGARGRRLFGKVTEAGGSGLPAGFGETDKFGNVLYSTLGTADDVNLVRYHESVHSLLSPKLKLFRELRADIGMTAYNRSALLRYLEESLAESYAQLRVHGLRSLPTGIKFPIKEGYVTIQAVAAEGAFGTIVIGGVAYYVFYDVE